MRHGSSPLVSPSSPTGQSSSLQMLQQPIYGQFVASRQQQNSPTDLDDNRGAIYGHMQINKGRNEENGGREGSEKIKGTRRGRQRREPIWPRIRPLLTVQLQPFWNAFRQRFHSFLQNRPWHLWLSLFALVHLFLFLLLLSFVFFLHLHAHHGDSPSSFFFLALLSLGILLATGSAFLAILPSQNGAILRLRPLLLLTCLLPLAGLPLLWLPLPLCFHLPRPMFGLQCHPRPLPIVTLALLVTSLLLVRPLLQHWLLKLRQKAILRALCALPLESATFFNHFCARMETIAESEEQRQLIAQWRDGFGQQLRNGIEQQEMAKLASSEKQFHVEGVSGKWEDQSILMGTERNWRRRRKSRNRSSTSRDRPKGSRERSVQFSQLLLLREISCVQNEVGQFVEMDKHRKFVLESLYADFVRDFRLRMSPRGLMLSNSARQIFTRFGPVETMHYTKMTASEGGGSSYGYGNLGRKEGMAEGKRAKKKKPDRDYATIDSAGEATNELRTAVAKCLGQSVPARQLQPQVPSTPIPQTTPTDPLGPQFVEGSRPLLPTSLALYENLTLRTGQSRLEEVKEEREKEESAESEEEKHEKKQGEEEEKPAKKREEKHGRNQWEDEEKPSNNQKEWKEEKHEKKKEEKHMKKQKEKEEKHGKKQKEAEACTCPMGIECLVLTARASAHYFYIKPDGASRLLDVLEKNEGNRANLREEEADEEEETSYFTRR